MPQGEAIFEIKHARDEREANRYLKSGWVYLDTVQSEGQIITVLGWTMTQGPVHPPAPPNILNEVARELVGRKKSAP
jgi:hypothetical protein